MVIDLSAHGIGLGRRSRRDRDLRGNFFEDLTDAVVSRVSTDPEIKATTAAKAVELATGVRPKVDTTSQPGVTWLRLLPAHGEFVDSVFAKGVRQITAGPSKGQPANFKVDVMPALAPVLWRRVAPLAGLAFLLSLGVGIYIGKKQV